MKNNEQTPRNQSGRSSNVIRIEFDLFNEIERLSTITRTPAKDIASKAIRFALQYAVTKPVECFDVEFMINRKSEG